MSCGLTRPVHQAVSPLCDVLQVYPSVDDVRNSLEGYPGKWSIKVHSHRTEVMSVVTDSNVTWFEWLLWCKYPLWWTNLLVSINITSLVKQPWQYLTHCQSYLTFGSFKVDTSMFCMVDWDGSSINVVFSFIDVVIILSLNNSLFTPIPLNGWISFIDSDIDWLIDCHFVCPPAGGSLPYSIQTAEKQLWLHSYFQ